MNMRRPARAAQALNAAAEQPTVEGAKNSRGLIEEVRQALITARLFGPIVAEYGPSYSKLICPQKNDESHPRTMIVIHTDMSLTLRHPRDCASDTIIRPLIYKSEEYADKDIGQFVIDGIAKLHSTEPRPDAPRAPGLKL